MNEKVLIIVDMQNDFVDAALGTKEAVQIVPEVVRAIQDPSYDMVIATLDTHHENYLSTLEGRYLPVEHCIENTEGWQFNPQVEDALAARGAMILKKPTFGSRTLAEMLQEMQPAQVDFCGLCTDICVLSNALMVRAALPDTEMRVLAKACAGTTPEKHNAAIAVLGSCQIPEKEDTDHE
ncbi:MAG: cysteine hydrolase [Solobacterium sp.]|nr:cysteine hydrolase [Solobacterium sp.]